MKEYWMPPAAWMAVTRAVRVPFASTTVFGVSTLPSGREVWVGGGAVELMEIVVVKVEHASQGSSNAGADKFPEGFWRVEEWRGRTGRRFWVGTAWEAWVDLGFLRCVDWVGRVW